MEAHTLHQQTEIRLGLESSVVLPFLPALVDNFPLEHPVLWVSMIKVQICFNYFRSMLAAATVETPIQC